MKKKKKQAASLLLGLLIGCTALISHNITVSAKDENGSSATLSRQTSTAGLKSAGRPILFEAEQSPSYITKPLEFNQPLAGNLAEYADRNYYTFTAPEAGMLNLVFRHEKAGESSHSTWTMYLYSNHSIVADFSIPANADLSTDEMSIRPGEYTIEIYSSISDNFSSNPYTIEADYTPGKILPMACPDVSGSSLDYLGILYAKENGLMSGYANGNFGPENNLTRGELITILHRMEGSPLSANPGFDDVPVDSFYKAATNWARESGVLTGNLHPDGSWSFDGEKPVTRQDAALIFYRYAKNIRQNLTRGPLAYYCHAFDDEIGSWALDGVHWALSNNLLRLEVFGGFDDPYQEALLAGENAKRGWIATLIQRYLDPSYAGIYNTAFYSQIGNGLDYDQEYRAKWDLSTAMQKGAFNPSQNDSIAYIDFYDNGTFLMRTVDGTESKGNYKVETSSFSTLVKIKTETGASWSWPVLYREEDGCCLITSNGILVSVYRPHWGVT